MNAKDFHGIVLAACEFHGVTDVRAQLIAASAYGMIAAKHPDKERKIIDMTYLPRLPYFEQNVDSWRWTTVKDMLIRLGLKSPTRGQCNEFGMWCRMQQVNGGIQTRKSNGRKLLLLPSTFQSPEIM